jgi:predicted AlkP superfamily pyrophosphatase or phosphodiesterase
MKRAAAWALPIVLVAALSGWWIVAASRPLHAIRHVLIISIDGLRPDLIDLASTPVIHGLMRSGSYTLHARTVAEGYTVPSHVSMLTGVVPSRHGVTWDNHIEDAYSNVPTLFELAKRRGYTTAVVTGKTKLIVLTKPGTLDWSHIGNESRERDADVAREATTLIREHHPDVLFVHFGDVDTVGHASGWGSPEQLRAVTQADQAIGWLQDALKETSRADSTLMIVTADHGGTGTLHPPDDPLSQYIPWIAVGPSIGRDVDLAKVPGLTITTMATFSTACDALRIDVSNVDGRSILSSIALPLRGTDR